MNKSNSSSSSSSGSNDHNPDYQSTGKKGLDQSIQQKMLQKNSVFEKLLKTEDNSETQLQEIIAVLSKKSEYRSREDLKRLANYFQGLKFFESLKKESDVDDDIIIQCCRELKYRRYEEKEYVMNYGEEGDEFFIIIAGEVNIYTPKPIDLKFSLSELMHYIEENQDFILWERHNKYYLEMYNNYKKVNHRHHHHHQVENKQITSAMRKSFQNIIEKEHRFNFDHQLLTLAMTLQKGLGFGELALMSNNQKKSSSKRSATVICKSDLHCALLDKEDFQKVFMHSMQKKLDAKVEFFKNFRISDGISRVNLNKLSYFLKEKQFRSRDIVYKEGDIADQIYFIKEGEFEISKRVKTQLSKTSIQKIQNSSLLRTLEVKVSIIGPNQIIGLDDLQKDKISFRDHKVTCITEKALVYFLTREEYFSRFYKQLSKNVINESSQLKEPFFSQRIKSLQNLAINENTKYLKQKERFLTKETMSLEELQECKHVVDQVQNEELCNLLMKHKLLKRPQIKIERITSENEEELNDFDPSRYTNKDYFLRMSRLYNQFVFNTNQLGSQTVYSPSSPKSPFSQNDQRKQSTLKSSEHDLDLQTEDQEKLRTLSKPRLSIFSQSPRQRTGKVSIFMAG